mmetsp:Transcript_27224/g.82071  ORF Transcript_27224/g.82071 Transcript_27224/m.82071 type:complete len:218 (+) Transcript_27224:146-799(+)
MYVRTAGTFPAPARVHSRQHLRSEALAWRRGGGPNVIGTDEAHEHGPGIHRFEPEGRRVLERMRARLAKARVPLDRHAHGVKVLRDDTMHGGDSGLALLPARSGEHATGSDLGRAVADFANLDQETRCLHRLEDVHIAILHVNVRAPVDANGDHENETGQRLVHDAHARLPCVHLVPELLHLPLPGVRLQEAGGLRPRGAGGEANARRIQAYEQGLA